MGRVRVDTLLRANSIPRVLIPFGAVSKREVTDDLSKFHHAIWKIGSSRITSSLFSSLIPTDGHSKAPNQTNGKIKIKRLFGTSIDSCLVKQDDNFLDGTIVCVSPLESYLHRK